MATTKKNVTYLDPEYIFPKDFDRKKVHVTPVEDFGSRGGQKINILYKTEEGDRCLVFTPNHWGKTYGIQEKIPFEEKDVKKKEEEELKKKDDIPQYEITYVLEDDSEYDADNKKCNVSSDFFDAVNEFVDEVVQQISQDEYIEELPKDVQTKLKSGKPQEAIRTIFSYPNKTVKVERRGKVKELKEFDYTKPPRIYGIRVLRSKKGWITTMVKASSKDDNAETQEVDPTTCMNQYGDIRPALKFEYFFVKENKLCLQIRLMEAIFIPTSGKRIGGLLTKKYGYSNFVRQEHAFPEAPVENNTNEEDGANEEPNVNNDEEEERKRKRVEARKKRLNKKDDEDN